jgi:hypothetical protein
MIRPALLGRVRGAWTPTHGCVCGRPARRGWRQGHSCTLSSATATQKAIEPAWVDGGGAPMGRNIPRWHTALRLRAMPTLQCSGELRTTLNESEGALGQGDPGMSQCLGVGRSHGIDIGQDAVTRRGSLTDVAQLLADFTPKGGRNRQISRFFVVKIASSRCSEDLIEP